MFPELYKVPAGNVVFVSGVVNQILFSSVNIVLVKLIQSFVGILYPYIWSDRLDEMTEPRNLGQSEHILILIFL